MIQSASIQNSLHWFFTSRDINVHCEFFYEVVIPSYAVGTRARTNNYKLAVTGEMGGVRDGGWNCWQRARRESITRQAGRIQRAVLINIYIYTWSFT